MINQLILPLMLVLLCKLCEASDRPLVIGHRGCGYLPELTLEAQTLGHALGADMVEIDINLSRDNQLVVVHDLYLDAISNVAEVYPNRNRSDGYHYLLDFDSSELRNLTVHERVVPFSNTQVYPARFPSSSLVPFRLSTLNETLELLLGLRSTTGRSFQLLIEIKTPEYYRHLNRPISSILLDTLKAYNLTESDDPVVIQTFYVEELLHIRRNLLSRLRLVALMSWNYMNESSSDFDFYGSEEGLRNLSSFVDGIAPNMELLVNSTQNGSILGGTPLSDLARRFNLSIYAWTFRQDTYKGDFLQLIDYFNRTVRVDGFITSQPDVVLNFLTKSSSVGSAASERLTYVTSLLICIVFSICSFTIRDDLNE